MTLREKENVYNSEIEVEMPNRYSNLLHFWNRWNTDCSPADHKGLKRTILSMFSGMAGGKLKKTTKGQ